MASGQTPHSDYTNLRVHSPWFDTLQVLELEPAVATPEEKRIFRLIPRLRWGPSTAIRRITIAEPYLARVLWEMEQEVPEWKAMWDSIRNDSVPIFISGRGTEEYLVRGLNGERMSLLAGGQVIPLTYPSDSLEIRGLVMLLDWEHIVTSLRFQYSARSARMPLRPMQRQLELDTRALIIHETIHLNSFRRSKRADDFCRDPEEGEAEMDSCVMREQIRWHRSFGLSPPRRYGVYPGETEPASHP